MIIQMTTQEYQEVKKFIQALNNKTITKYHNEVFTNTFSGGVTGMVTPSKKDVIVTIPENLAIEIGKVFVSHGSNISKIFSKGCSISNLTKCISLLKNIGNDLIETITHR